MIENLTQQISDVASIIEALVMIGAALGALFAWLGDRRRAGLLELVPAAVSLVQDASVDFRKLHGRSMPEKAKLVAQTLSDLARKRGLTLSPAEVEYGVSLASAEHKARKLDASGYASKPEVPPDPPRAPGSTSPAPGASSPASPPNVLPGSP